MTLTGFGFGAEGDPAVVTFSDPGLKQPEGVEVEVVSNTVITVTVAPETQFMVAAHNQAVVL